MRKFYLFVLATICCLQVFAQRNVILEQVRTFSMVGPVMQYMNSPETRNTFIHQLNDNLLKHKNAKLADTGMRVIRLPDLKTISSASSYFTIADTSTWHLYIDLYEFETNAFYYSQPEYRDDSLLFKRAASVFQLGILLINSTKEILLNEVMTICISRGNSNGFGIMAASPALTSKGFTDMLNLATGRLLSPDNTADMIEVKAAPAFYADNFILPVIGNFPVFQLTQKNNIASYKRNEADEIIRMGESVYEQLIVRGKNKTVSDTTLLGRIIYSSGRQNSSDFIQLRQECRDVVRNKNYTLKMFIEINTYFNYMNEDEAFTAFMPDTVHCLLGEKDTIAKFAIVKNIGLPDRKLYLNKLSNGYDSTTVFSFSSDDRMRNVLCEYQITGKLQNKPFIIRCSDMNALKEFVYDKKTVAIARGKFLPERFAVFDASLDTEILHQLMMIGFSRFFR